MNIALIGASGNIGKKITAELLSRGHRVTGIVRSPEKLPAHAALKPIKADVADTAALAGLLRGHDAVVSSLHFSVFGHAAFLGAVKASGVTRYISVGGAGSLLLPDGTRVIDDPHFPEAWRGEAGAGATYLDLLRTEKDLEWTFISPSAFIAPGERTGKFRLGSDQLLIDESAGKSHISEEDYAVALVDELENPRHIRLRFTVGY